ncbi:MAG: hypothetical protein IT372_26050 [Polyangiaceae bacterium]|nr:hypothetical protein [Polyangiaceae bacterium]
MRFRRILLVLPVIFALGCGGAYAKAIGRADELARQGQWDLAAAEYERAVALDPGSPEAAMRLAWARRGQAAERVRRARAALAQGDAPGALALATEAASLDPASVEARQAAAEAGARTLDLAEQLVAAGDARRALDLTTLALRAAPWDARAQQLDSGIRQRLAGEAYARGEAFEREGRLGNALLETAASALYVPGYRDAPARVGQLSRALREAVTFTAVIGPFSGDGSAPDLAAGLRAERLRRAVDPALPLEVIAADAEGAKDTRVRPGVKISGGLERYAYRHDEASEVRSCLYVCGRSTIANPARPAAEEALADAEARLSAAEAELPRAQAEASRAEREVDRARRAADAAQREADRARAELDRCRARPGIVPQDCASEEAAVERTSSRLRSEQARLAGPEGALASARARLAVAEDRREEARRARARAARRLAGTPRTIEVERRCSHGYAVAAHAVAAVVTVTVSGDGLADGAKIFDREPLLCEERGRDEAFPAQPGRCAEVAGGDPLELPSELELKHALLTQATAGVRDKILFAYDRYRREHLTSAQREQAAGVVDEASERYARYLALGRAAPAERAAIVDYLARARGLTPAAVEASL